MAVARSRSLFIAPAGDDGLRTPVPDGAPPLSSSRTRSSRSPRGPRMCSFELRIGVRRSALKTRSHITAPRGEATRTRLIGRERAIKGWDLVAFRWVASCPSQDVVGLSAGPCPITLLPLTTLRRTAFSRANPPRLQQLADSLSGSPLTMPLHRRRDSSSRSPAPRECFDSAARVPEAYSGDLAIVTASCDFTR